MRLSDVQTLEDLRRRAAERLPRFVADFYDGAADDEITMRRNCSAFDNYELRPHYLVDVSKRDQSTTVLDTPMPFPIVLGPSGSHRLAHIDGELAVARAAGAHGITFALSVFSTYTLEHVAAAASAPLWFQVYLWKDREVTKWLVDRARDAGYRALILTLDVPQQGRRLRDLRNNTKVPPKVTFKAARDVVRHPRWGWWAARRGLPTFASMEGIEAAEGNRHLPIIAYVNQYLFDPSKTWDELVWLRSIWDGPIAAKGILRPDDAKVAVSCGADGVIVSNHGGRQLDGTPASIDVLGDVVDAVGSEAQVLLDGGVRRGTDVIKALALGARAVLVVRPYWYGLGAAGEAGVRKAIEILTTETDRAMALSGVTHISDIDTSLVRRR